MYMCPQPLDTHVHIHERVHRTYITLPPYRDFSQYHIDRVFPVESLRDLLGGVLSRKNSAEGWGWVGQSGEGNVLRPLLSPKYFYFAKCIFYITNSKM